MPNLEIQKRSLSQLYVFYERLKDDGYTDLYGYINKSLNDVGANINEIIGIATNIKAIAKNEAQKEQNLLNRIFNANISLDLKNKESMRTFIDTLNACLGLKEVYERNKALIKGSNGKKSVISFFPTYFLRVWNNRWGEGLGEKINKMVDELKDSDDILTKISNIITPEIEDLVPKAIQEMFEAEPELKSMPEEMKNAYSSLIGAIGKVQQQGSLANQISNIYKLDELSQLLTNAIVQKATTINVDVKNFVEKNMAQRGGLTLEAIENTVFNMIANGLKGSINNAKVSAFATGSSEIKADNIISFNLDPQEIQDALESSEKVSRKRNIEMFDKLEQNLSNVRDGYIVYSSDKNYTYNKGFEERGGFQADNISLETYMDIMGSVNKNIRTFVGTILQTTKGAIGEENYPKLQKAIAQDVAYFLFDDFKTIGNEVEAGDTQAIHVMNLNGVYIPLSFFLFLFAEAIEDNIGKPEDFVKVDIKRTSILFKTKKEQSEWQKENGASAMDAWRYQRETALTNTKIEVHFLRQFKQMIEQYL